MPVKISFFLHMLATRCIQNIWSFKQNLEHLFCILQRRTLKNRTANPYASMLPQTMVLARLCLDTKFQMRWTTCLQIAATDSRHIKNSQLHLLIPYRVPHSHSTLPTILSLCFKYQKGHDAFTFACDTIIASQFK